MGDGAVFSCAVGLLSPSFEVAPVPIANCASRVLDLVSLECREPPSLQELADWRTFRVANANPSGTLRSHLCQTCVGSSPAAGRRALCVGGSRSSGRERQCRGVDVTVVCGRAMRGEVGADRARRGLARAGQAPWAVFAAVQERKPCARRLSKGHGRLEVVVLPGACRPPGAAEAAVSSLRPTAWPTMPSELRGVGRSTRCSGGVAPNLPALAPEIDLHIPEQAA